MECTFLDVNLVLRFSNDRAQSLPGGFFGLHVAVARRCAKL